MKTLRVLFESTFPAPIQIDREQVRDQLKHVRWQTLTPAQIANYLVKNTRPWRVDPSSMPKGTIDVPDLAMPHIFFFRLSRSYVNGDELVLTFSGPSIGNVNPYDKFYYERRDWEWTQQCVGGLHNLLHNHAHLIPSTDTCTGDQWVAALIDNSYMDLLRGGTLTYEETELRINMVWDIFCWDTRDTEVRFTNEETFKKVSEFYGFTPPEDGYDWLEPEDWDDFFVALEQHWAEFWDAFNAQVQESRRYAMAILTHPLERAKKTLKRKADGTCITQHLPKLPHLPTDIRKLIDAYNFTS